MQISHILKDLEKKMVFIVGPRQVGKTYLAKDIAKHFNNVTYLNYDSISDQQIIAKEAWLDSTELLIFDELHKMPNWKNYLKGVYDTKPEYLKILVTGSARIDIFNRMGDSLAGRYFTHHLLPLSMAELKQLNKTSSIDYLLERGGFPEPYLAQDNTEAKRWRQQYVNSLLSTDVFEFDRVHNIKALHMTFELLRHRVGSPVSYQSLAEDVAVSPTTIKRYIQILEAIYVVFKVTPHSKNIARSLLKEPKIYFYDTGLVNGDDGIKFENLVAVSLLKHVYAKIDYHAENYALHYLRTKDKQEVDFALTKDQKIENIIEAKLSNHAIEKSLKHFHKKYNLPAIQLVKSLRQERKVDHINILKAERYLSELDL